MESTSMVREIKMFLFYSKYIWPFHRKLLRTKITARCRKCILSSKLATLDSSGLCEYCQKDQDSITSINQPNYDKQLAQLLTSASGRTEGPYDALVMYSGGKDSTYLVHRIRNEYPELRILLFTVDNTFMSPIALENIKDLVKKLDIDHLVFRPPAAVYEKMFRYAFLHLNEKGCSGTVDQFDGDLFFDIGRNWAAQNNIPIILNGLSKTQIEKILKFYHFESPADIESQNRTTVAGIELAQIFTSSEMKYWWQGHEQKKKGKAPRFICPFYVWDPSESEIVQTISKAGLMPKGASNPIFTNNQLVPLMAIVDMCRDGYSSFELEFSHNVRAGKADATTWRHIFELSEYSAKTGKFISQSLDETLTRLKLKRKDLGIPE